MNFDDIKSAWDKDSGNDMEIPQSVKLLRKAQHPIEQLKRNIRNEWYIQLASVLIFGTYPLLFNVNKNLYVLFYALYLVMIAISFYYGGKFKNLFKHLGCANLSSKDNLYELYYELRLNMEMYKSFTFVITPFALIMLGICIRDSTFIKYYTQNNISTVTFIPLLALILFTMGLIILLTHWWVEHFYGKYAKQIKQLLDELKEE
jgi:Ca2+/Na+ antiporter